ncbi:hypothetical protein L2E82_14771 [Cichorium intybus]|uniref:Uncharacterized protein n=1 Tax=Cichorium intybus TaxID=13427 RepID=A0ACB9F1C9_CICIN|nr:hypothetical protein L2E82_14771 [Cichorium intybus]
MQEQIGPWHIDNGSESMYFKLIFSFILQYIEYGTEESILLVDSCLHHFKIYEKGLKSTHLEPAVASLFRKLMEKPYFCKVFSGLVKHIPISKEFLDNLSTAMQLSPFEKLGFGLALSDSENNDVRMAGRNFYMAQFEVLLLEMPRIIVMFPHFSTPQNLLQNEVSSPVLPVLHSWHVNPPFFSRALNAALNLNTENINRLVDLFQELEVLEEHTALLSSNEISKEMESLCITSTHNGPVRESISEPDSSTFEIDAYHIETEANAYFQQMFSRQLTVDAMVRMLTQFKGSSEKRMMSMQGKQHVMGDAWEFKTC